MNGLPLYICRRWVFGVLLALGASTAWSAPIVLVQGTTSTPNEAERNYAGSIARRLSCRLQELNLAHVVVRDDALSAESLRGARVAILAYNPFLPPREQDILKSFVARGGRLIVFYGADPAFAGWMGFKLGPPLSPNRNGNWCRIRFTGEAPRHVPASVEQESRMIRPAFPGGEQSRIIARWERADGSSTGDPAWLQSPRGFWMTHILLDDGDEENKQQMLLALIAACDPSQWKPAADGALSRAGRLGRFEGLDEALTTISREGSGTPAEWPARAVLGQARMLRKNCVVFYEGRKYAEVVEQCRRVNDLLAKAYGMIQAPRTGEIRGVWDHAGTGLYPGNWDSTCAVLAENGFTDIFSNLLWPGAAHYPSRFLTRTSVFTAFGDQVKASTEAAHRHGLKLHVWKVCWRLDNAPAELVARLRKEGRLQVSDAGQTSPWLCPSHPENLQLEKDGVREVVKSYPVDGIHLDYIRYQDSHYCYCSGCRMRFEAQTGQRVARWPREVTEGARVKEYRRWRCAQMTRLVRDVAAVARAANPRVKVSAAVYGKYPSCVDSVGQDWAAWVADGLVDFVCPMDYTTDLRRFGSYVHSQMALPAARGRVLPGLGVTATESRLDPAQVIDQIQCLRKEGAHGFVLFDLNRTVEREILPVLKLGVTAAR